MGDGNNYNFQKLTPTKDTKLNVYEEALDFVFENEDLRNVAISGAYSAGKSSMLESYKEKHGEKRFLHISLAHFETQQDEDNNQEEIGDDNKEGKSGKGTIKESILEGKILNQLIHQIDPKHIPQTNFRTKQRISNLQIAVNTILTIIFISAILYIVMLETWKSYVSAITIAWLRDGLLFFAREEMLIVSGMLALFLFGSFLYRVMLLQMNKGILRKFSFQGNDIEIFEDSEDSYFDKYLNEVLYLFDNADVDVVVFEDMDRFNANQIFVRLREVNSLINAQRKKRLEAGSYRFFGRLKKEKDMLYKPLRFFYLLRDDIFVSKDRTKFFDIIIPVIPVVDGSNSYDQFISHITAGGMITRFDQAFLQGLSLYIDDMRILKNIYNEFLIYFNRLNTIELDCDKMMALIVYKNVFPRDFSELQLQKGYVYTIFSKKSEFILSEIDKLERQLADIKEQIDAVDQTFLLSNEDLSLLFQEKKKKAQGLAYHERQEKIRQIEADYLVKEKIINNVKNNRRPILEAQKVKIEKDIGSIQNKLLKEIISRENSEQIFAVNSINDIKVERKFHEIKGNDYIDLLKFLITHGYIDETYADYMSYFYTTSLSITDKKFLRGVTDRKAKEYSYKLIEPAKVVSKLGKKYFEQPEILNYDLIFYLLKSKDENKYLDTLFQQLEQNKNFAFIQGVFLSEYNDDLDLLVNKLNSSWVGFLSEILSNTDFVENCRDEFILRTLYHTPDEDIKEINIDECLTEHISHTPSFLNIESPKVNRLIARFTLLKIAFISLEYDLSNKELFQAVYKNDLYELNYPNILLMLRTKYENEPSNDTSHRNLTLIMSDQDSPLSKYVWNNINQYLSIIFNECSGLITDAEGVIISVLNSEDVLDDNKVAYVNALKTQISTLKDVNDESLWKQLIQCGIVLNSERNIIDYFLNNDNILTEELIQLIDVPNATYNFSEISQQYGDETASHFFVAILKCNKLSSKQYRKILTSMNKSYNKGFSIKGIVPDKFNILIDTGIIKMHIDSLEFIREHYPEAVLSYIKKYIKDYVENIITAETFAFDELIEVLSLDVADSHKIKLLGYTREAISIVAKRWSDAVKIHILKNNLMLEDISQLALIYSQESSGVKLIIEELVIKHRETVIADEKSIDIELLDKLILSGKITLNDKIRIFAITVETLNEKQCRKILAQLHLDDYEGLLNQKRPKFEINDVNEKILTSFEKKRWISSFDVDRDDTNYYRAYGRRIHVDRPEFLD